MECLKDCEIKGGISNTKFKIAEDITFDMTAVLFHNYNRVTSENQHTNLQSVGADLLFDMVFINNIFSEITGGFRNAYTMGPLPEGKKNRYHFEFVFDIPAF